MTKQTIHLSHIDLDGYGCTLFVKALNIATQTLNINYDVFKETLQTVSKDSSVIITDLSATEDMRDLLESFSEVIFIDHHETSLWMNDRPLKNAIYTKVSADRCATYLLYEYFKEKGYRMNDEWFMSYATLVDDHDRWIHSTQDSIKLNSLLFLSNRDYFIREALHCDAYSLLAKNHEKIDRYLAQIDEYVKNTPIRIFDKDGIRVATAFAEKYKSQIADFCFKKDWADLIFIIDIRTGTVSIRSAPTSGIDCSRISEESFGGGGHFNASGGTIDTELFEALCSFDSHILIGCERYCHKKRRCR